MDPVCRVCMRSSENLVDIFTTVKEQFPSLELMINESVEVKVTRRDKFSKRICRDCISDVHSAFRLKRNYELTLKHFKKKNKRVHPSDDKKEESQHAKRQSAEHQIEERQNEDKPALEETSEKSDNPSESEGQSLSEAVSVDDEDAETSKEEYICHICDKVFANKQNWKRHAQVHTGVRSFQCEYCLRRFGWKANLDRHLKFHKICSKGASRKKDVLDGTVKGSSLQSETNTKSKELHTTDKNTTEAEKSATQKKIYKAYTRKDKLDIHLRVHTGKRPYSCSNCKATFHQLSNLRKHQQIIHKNLRPFNCSHCNKSFRHKSPLEIHLRTHTGKRDFQCKLCPRAFTIKHNLHRHVRTLHANIQT